MGRAGWIVGAVTLALHAFANAGYGWFRDELYFIVCGWHPDWGYVDQPPLVPLIAAATHFLAPSSPWLMRMTSGLAHAATVVLAAETAFRLGGRAFAQAMAAGSVLTAPVFLATGTILSTDVFQPLTWLVCAYAIVRIERENDPRWCWAVAGAAAIGLWSKYMIAFWLVAVFIGLVATPARRILADRWPWIAAGATLVVILPNVLWQAAHGFPFLALGGYAVAHKNPALSVMAFMWGEAKDLNLGALPIWLAGLGACAVSRGFSGLRCFAIAYAVLIAAMIVLHGKTYYPAGAYPVLFAAGSVVIERSAIRYVIATSMAVFGAIGLPFGLPILPIQTFIAYQGYVQPGPLPQLYADMFGWPEMVAIVHKAYEALPPEERARSIVFASNYGDASAVQVLGGMASISGHNNYDLWGAQGHDGGVVIRIGGGRDGLSRAYASVEPVGTVDQPLAMSWVNGEMVWICRGRHIPLDQAWASFRHYD
jgi:4-amino-4-deoxy-L-arabinose transferase-like glycosyltransferase